jgi:phosphoribosylaminoimidazole-succinocarboxamide synthase
MIDMPKVLLKPEFKNLNLIASGKVREIYSTGENLLFVSSDRLSAFDVIMNQGIPYKGAVLNSISAFWFDYTKDLIPNHFITMDVNKYPAEFKDYLPELEGRSMLVKKGKIVPIECIVRGYLSGTGWNDYRATGRVSGIKLPVGLLESEKLDDPIFTPSTKAEIGKHDENISFETACETAGRELMENIREKAITIYRKCSEYALERGVIIADTKMEFALDSDGELMLADEVLTPDSSRFWDIASYEPGRAQNSYDKQFVRDFLLSIGFNKQPPAPDLPEEIIQKTSEKYLEAYSKLTGKTLI